MDQKTGSLKYRIFVLYCYTHAAIHTRKDRNWFNREPQTTYCGVFLDTRSIVVKKGNRKAQCQVKNGTEEEGGEDKITMLLKSSEVYASTNSHANAAQLSKCNVCIYCIGCVPSNQTYIRRIHFNLNTKIKCIIDTWP